MFLPQGGLGRLSGAGWGYEEDGFVAVADDGGMEDEDVEKGQRVRQVDGGPQHLRADRVRFFGGQRVDDRTRLADFALDGYQRGAVGAVAEDAGVRFAGEDDLTVGEGERLAGGDGDGICGNEGKGHGVRRGPGGKQQGVAVFDEGAVGQEAHGHAGNAVVVRHEAVLYGKCAHTMGRAGAISGVLWGVRS